MCYNCGCSMPNNDMGNPQNITNQTFAEAARAMNQTIRQAQMNTLELLCKVLTAQEQSQDTNWQPAEAKEAPKSS